jgi:hypothetical protein
LVARDIPLFGKYERLAIYFLICLPPTKVPMRPQKQGFLEVSPYNQNEGAKPCGQGIFLALVWRFS